MEWYINETHTLYAVYLTLPEDTEVKIGSLGTFLFQNGNYVYIGSAKKNLRKRVERHYKIDKPCRWHLDYLRPYCIISKIQSFDDNYDECGLAKALGKSGIIPVKNFGSSDCKCGGHLLFLDNDNS